MALLAVSMSTAVLFSSVSPCPRVEPRGTLPWRVETSSATDVPGTRGGEESEDLRRRRGLVAGAIGLDLLSRGDLEAATACLEEAARSIPESAEIARDLAVAYVHAGKYEEAEQTVDRALALGDRDPEAEQLRAIIFAALDRPIEAIAAARRSRTWEGDLIAAALGDERAAYGVADLSGEETPRGALVALVLAAHAAERGERTTARFLVEAAAREAESSNAPIAINAAHALEQRLGEESPLGFFGRVRTSIDHATNPAFLAETGRARDTGLRLAVLGEGALQVLAGTLRIDAALRIDQHVFLTERTTLHELDLTGIGLAASVEVPISRHPAAAVVGLRVRFVDAFADRFRVHYATSLEGGPNLALPLGSVFRLELGFFGVARDFVDQSPPDARVSSLNRDHVGQRAAIALSFRTDWLDGRAETMFLRDDAVGDAFDAIGGALSGRLKAYPGGGVVLLTGVAVTGREFGPVGDSSIIGPASTRTEFRTVAEIGARIPLAERSFFVVEDAWIRNNARKLHAYTENVLSIGLEQIF